MESTETKQVNGHKLAIASLITGNLVIVIFCHGYRSSSIGPNRFFVEASRLLATHGISSLRFDQYGSGNSEGSFQDSSFNDWVNSTNALVDEYSDRGFTVCLFGQSMGGATVIATASGNTKIKAVVSWVPDPNVDTFEYPKNGKFEEGGQIVQASYWQEAHDAKIADKLTSVLAPTYIVQCRDDEYVSTENHNAVIENAQPHHTVEMFENHTHSSWSNNQATTIINKSVQFIVEIVGTSSN